VKHRELVSGWLFGRPSVNLGKFGSYNDMLSGPVLGNVFPFEILGMKASLGIYSFYPQHGAGVINIHSSPWNFDGACAGNCGGKISPGGSGVQLRIPRRLPVSTYLSSDAQQHLDFVTGLGLKLHDKLYVGAGLRANVKILGDVDVDFVQTSKGVGALAPTPIGGGVFTGQIAARPTFGWILGALFDTGKGVKIGASWKQETRSIFRQGLNSQATLPTTGDLSIVIPVRGQLNLDTAFQPQEATIGAAWDINDRWTVTADFTWEDWSRFAGNEMRADFAGIEGFNVPPNQGNTGQGNIIFEPRPNVDSHDIFITVGIRTRIKGLAYPAGWAQSRVMGDPGAVGLSYPRREQEHHRLRDQRVELRGQRQAGLVLWHGARAGRSLRMVRAATDDRCHLPVCPDGREELQDRGHEQPLRELPSGRKSVEPRPDEHRSVLKPAGSGAKGLGDGGGGSPRAGEVEGVAGIVAFK
jgi:hypothetical protein